MLAGSTVKKEGQMALPAHEQLITDEKLIAEANEFADDVVKIRDDLFHALGRIGSALMLAGPDDEEEWQAWLQVQSDKRREQAGDEWDKERQFDPFDPRIAQLLMAYEARQNYELEVLLRIKEIKFPQTKKMPNPATLKDQSKHSWR